MKRFFLLFAVLLSLWLSACAGDSSSPIQVKDAWVRAAMAMEAEMGEMGAQTSHMAGNNSAAYMTLVNASNQSDRLLGAQSDVAESVELHQSQTEGGVTSMTPVEAIEVPANGQVNLEPGGLHIMLIGLKRELKVGDTVQLTLEFEKAGKIQLAAEVRAP